MLHNNEVEEDNKFSHKITRGKINGNEDGVFPSYLHDNNSSEEDTNDDSSVSSTKDVGETETMGSDVELKADPEEQD